MTLGTFTPRTRITGDKIDLRQSQWYGRPMLMRCNEYSDSFSSKMQDGKMVEAIWVDVVDLASGSILINCLFTSGVIVDNLKEHAGTEVTLPVKISKQAGGKFGGYAILEALTEQEQAAAGAWYQQYWGLVDQERAKREAAARPLQNQAPGGFNPAQGFAPANQAPAQQAAPPQQFQQPAPQGLPHDQGQYGNQPGAWAPNPQNDPNAGQQFAQPQQAPAQQFQQADAPGQYVDPNQGQAPAQQFAQPGQAPAFGQPAPQQGQPSQGFGQAAQGGAPGQGMFTDAPPPVDPNQGFAAPNAQNMLAQLNNQLQ